ncbi:hypothetical protein [Roseivirga echinicomitans]|uniref:Uncharacterized protein n=1 Tax=Roseivirga echinicomitans TaxID=296218 RepID=A0A150XUK8_9BACT|nr:hypothetical protein [Roseivirga echinicomitans]KYG82302.1 hypothetical protein AWN68_15800 [Roseivirga echinicomitans]
MNNSTISLQRLSSLVKLTLHLNLKRMLYTACIGLGFAILFIVIYWNMDVYYNDMVFSRHEYLFVLSLYISGFIFTGSCFIRFRSKQGTIDYLMLPASNTEKFISEFLLATLVYPLFFLLSYWLFSVIVNGVLNNISQAFFMPFSFNIAPYGLDFMVYFFIQTIFLFGAACFQKIPLMKIVLWALLVAAIIALLFYTAWLNFDYSKGTDELAMNKIFYSSLVYNWHFLTIPVGLVFWLLAFLKLKEKEA